MRLSDALDQLPVALEPVYLTPQINQDIHLYDGDLEIICNDKVSKGIGSIYFKWFPIRGIEFQIELTSINKNQFICNFFNSNLNGTSISLKIPNSDSNIGFTLKNCNPLSSVITGYINEDGISIGSGDNLKYVLCHIANLHTCIGGETALTSRSIVQRNILEANGWKLTMDDVDSLREQEKQLKKMGGFAITHVAKLERADSQQFSETDARNFLLICSDFISFIRGFRIPIFLLVGFDQGDQDIWRYWGSNTCETWQNNCSWFPNFERDSLTISFPGFSDLYSEWDKSLKIVLNEYLESNANGRFNENSIVQIQIALELISWKVLVQEKRVLSKTQFKKISASDKIRKLLFQYNIPTQIPPECFDFRLPNSPRDPSKLIQDLQAFSQSLNPQWLDGPHAFTDIRNSIIHPEKSSRFDSASFDVLFQIRFLGIWYLEMVLLARTNYTGCYGNRLFIGRHTRNYDRLPWTNSIP